MSPTAAITGLFTIGGLSNFPQGRVTDAYQFSNTPDLDEEPPHAEVRGGHPLQQGLQPVRLQLEGQLHVQQPAGLHEQHRVQPHAGAADRQLGRDAVAELLLRAGRLPRHAGPDPEHRPALRAVDRAARHVRSHGPREPGRAGARPAGQGHEQLGAARRLQLVAPLEQQPARRRQDRVPRRLRDGLRRALLQPADRERLELPAHRDGQHQQRARHLPEPAAGRRQRRRSAR